MTNGSASIALRVEEMDGQGLVPTRWTGMKQYDPYLRNLEVFRCPSSNREWQWKASCYPSHGNHTDFKRPNRKINYSFNESVFNDVRGYTQIAVMKEPATFVILADNWNTFLTPWAQDVDGINVRIAYANGNPWDYGICVCPSNVTSMANEP